MTMVRARWIAALSIITIVTGVWWRAARSAPRLDLFALFGSAEKRTSLAPQTALSRGRFTIDGTTRRGIYARPTSRLAWHLTLPRKARLRVWLAIAEDAWDEPGDGAVFRIGVGIAQGEGFEELFRRRLNPSVWLADRRWVPVDVDLTRAGGREVDLVLLTEADSNHSWLDARNDRAIWGEPQVVGY